MNVGDTISVADLIAAWREGLRAEEATPGAVARSRIAQASFGVDLSADPPVLERTWTPDWVRDTHAFQHDRYLHRDLLARVARNWAALPTHADPFEGFIEAPLVIGALYERHARDGRGAGTEAPLRDLIATLWTSVPPRPRASRQPRPTGPGPPPPSSRTSHPTTSQSRARSAAGPAPSARRTSSTSAMSRTGSAHAARRCC